MVKTLIHYSRVPLGPLTNTTHSQTKLQRKGKPAGYWWAYGDAWKNHVVAGKVTTFSAANFAHKYAVELPDDAFTDALAEIAPTKIFVLSAANLDAFMNHFHKDKYIINMQAIYETAFYVLQRDGDSTVLDEAGEENPDFQMYIEELDTGSLTEKKVKTLIKRFKLTEHVPSDEALASDNIYKYNWVMFWSAVAKELGGVEFLPDLFEIKEWRGINMTWLKDVEIHSGVILEPTKFRGGIVPVKITEGGRRRLTRRRCRKGRN